MTKKKETIFIICAHSDDHVLGAGGTIKKYSQQGKKVINIILSKGEKSHPWLKEKITQKIRTKEAKEADKILGSKTLFFDLKEGRFSNKKEETQKKLKKLFRKYKPSKVFTHSSEDPHPDHLATHKIVLDTIKKVRSKPELYVFSIWNPFSFKKTYLPKMYINISDVIKRKKEAIRCFASQKYIIAFLVIGNYIKTFFNGLSTSGLFAEKFYRLK